ESGVYDFTLERDGFGNYTGKIDWNRDGIYETSARGAPQHLLGLWGCESPQPHTTYFLNSQTPAYSQAWLGRLSGSGMYLFTLERASTYLKYRRTSNIYDCNQSDTGAPCPTGWIGPSGVPNGGSTVTAIGPGATTSFTDPYNQAVPNAPTLMLIYRRTNDQQLMWQNLYIKSPTQVWSSPALT